MVSQHELRPRENRQLNLNQEFSELVRVQAKQMSRKHITRSGTAEESGCFEILILV